MSAVVDIVIPTFNQSDMTRACAESIVRSTPPGAARVVWVDNGSGGPELDSATRAWDAAAGAGLEVLLLRLPTNLGYVKATNAGIAVSTAPYVLLLNNDTELPPGWLEAMTAVMGERPEVGIVGPRSSAPGQWQGTVAEAPGYVAPIKQRMVSFFCALVRREVIVRCGYLSEEYRAGLGDDDDYCERALAAGWQLALRTDVTVKHHHRTTFRAVYGDGGWLGYQRENIELFREKWGGAKR